MPTLEIGFAVAALVVVLLLLLAGGAAWIAYRYTLPPVPRWKRLLLTALRATALGLTLLLLCEPLVRLVVTGTRPPVLAVLIDNSRSMQMRDRQNDRAAVVRDLLRTSPLQNLPRDGRILAGTFGVRPGELTPALPPSPALNEEATDIASALRAVAEQREEWNIRAVLLFTDGAYTLGQNPLHEADRLALPIFTVGIGDSAEQKDILITGVATNDLVYADTEVPVDVTVKSSGYAGQRLEVVLQQGTREIARAPITIEEGTREYPVRLTYTPAGEGMQKFTVRIPALEGELTVENNRKSFFSRVLKSRLRVLILAGGPSPDLAVIRQTLAEQRHLEVRSFTQRRDGGYFEGEVRRSAIDSADCLLLIGFPVSSTPGRTMELLATAVTERNTPLLYVDGKGVDEIRLRSLSPVLPFTATGPFPAEQFVFLAPRPLQKNHPILTAGQAGLEHWNHLPPIFRRQGSFSGRPEATVLGTVRLQNITTEEPLLVIRAVNRRKSLAVLGYGLWRWRLMAQGTPDTEAFLAGFLNTGIRWLTTRDDDRPVKTVTTRDQYTQGEPVEFAGQVYDAGAAPVDNAQLTVAVQDRQKEYTTTLRPIGNGRYEGRLEGLAPGEYAFRATAAIGDQPVGVDGGKFTVGELDLEFIDTRMNVALLRQLAARSGGAFYVPGEVSALPAALASLPSFLPRTVRDVTELEVWNWRVMLALIVFLFGVEWLIRKRSGML